MDIRGGPENRFYKVWWEGYNDSDETTWEPMRHVKEEKTEIKAVWEERRGILKERPLSRLHYELRSYRRLRARARGNKLPLSLCSCARDRSLSGEMNKFVKL